MYTGTAYRPLILKGINLGSSPPGYFPVKLPMPSRINLPAPRKWIRQMSDADLIQ